MIRSGVVSVAALLIAFPAGAISQVSERAEVVTVAYRHVDGDTLLADVYPVEGEGPHPVIVWLHGGALIFGDRSWVRPDFVEFAGAERIVLVSLDYRLAPEAQLRGILDDVEAGLEWVATVGARDYAIDPTRIVVAGNSAGGFLSLYLGGRGQPRPAAVVSYWGYGRADGEWYQEPAHVDGDLALLSEESVYQNGRLNRQMYYIFLRQTGGWIEAVVGLPENAAMPDGLNPISGVTAAYPPTFLVHGELDRDVPAYESIRFSEALGAVGVAHELVLVPGADHELEGGEATAVAAALDAAKEFIRTSIGR